MRPTQELRYRTGHVCADTGTYEFDGWVETPPRQEPAFTREISLRGGEVFPSAGDSACWWIPVGIDDDTDEIDDARERGLI